MAKCFLILSFLYIQAGVAQTINQFDGKWAFSGLRTTVFKVANEKLYVGMLEYTDTANFSRFIQGMPLDSMIFREATVSQKTDTIVISVKFPSIDHDLKLHFVPNDSNNIWYRGDVFFDSAKVIVTNTNCSLNGPGCINRLYDEGDLTAVMRLKTSEAFTRDDAFEFLLRLNQKLKSRCNRCYAGFTDAYMNEVLIEMGFNPIVKRTATNSLWYNTSGFTFYLKTKFSNDPRLVKLIDYVFDWYLK
ncbi:MAG TPA: hypothetical protein VK625_06885 [Flavitalea sp.]|nr:hypothetical protein [Flavitalea sp.]